MAERRLGGRRISQRALAFSGAQQVIGRGWLHPQQRVAVPRRGGRRSGRGRRGGVGPGGGGGGGYRSEPAPSLLPDLPHRRVTLYRSVERTRAVSLCGWGWGWESAGAGVERAEAEGTPCRAAALAAFHLRLRHALDVLARASKPQLRVVALALAGLSDERLWRDALAAATPALPDPYLRALLHFLAASAPATSPTPTTPPAASTPHLEAVLNERGMRLEDRVAFACLYLPDADLIDYLTRTKDELVEQGDLSGILLTGEVSNTSYATTVRLAHFFRSLVAFRLMAPDRYTRLPIRVLGHPPYSPDLAPRDFFLFPKLKNLLKGKCFHRRRKR
ncbi:hypothetical protein evm_002534 [Chilo suppressalis]|nr:hypothetical protein evm_002534 [Chilo suppressalis]